MQKYVNIYPSTTKAIYNPYDDLTFNISIPDGFEVVKQSSYLLGDYKYTNSVASPLATTILAQNANVNFNNFAGASCFLDDPKINYGSLAVETNFNYYSQYNKLVTEATVHPDELASQTKHTMELKCADVSQTKEYLRVNRSGTDGDLVGSFSHLLRCGLNRTNRNFNAKDIGGSIQVKLTLKDQSQAFYGADNATSTALFSNIRMQCLIQPISQTGLLTMKITQSVRQDIATGNAYFEYILPIATSSISSYFSTPAALTANPYSSVQPTISEVIYTFNNANSEVLSYNLEDTNEMIMNFRRSITIATDDSSDSNSFSVPRLNATTSSTFGLGLNFESYMPAGTKIGVNLYSSATNVDPLVMFSFFNGQVTLIPGEKVQAVSPMPQLTRSMPLNFGSVAGDMMQTYELVPKYHSQVRSEWVIEDQTVLSDLRLINLSPTTPAGRLVFQTGVAGLIKNCYLYADGKILLSSLQGSNAPRYYALKQLLKSNRSNKNVEYALDGSLWGFKSMAQPGSATLQITSDVLNRDEQNGAFQGRVELKNVLPILSQMDYLHFKQLRLVIEWNTTSASDALMVYTDATKGEAIVVNPPTLVYERVIPDRPLSECVFWDVLVDRLIQPIITGAAANPVQSNDNFIQAFDNKTVDSIIVVNDTGANPSIGSNVTAHAKFQEKFSFYDDNTSILPNEANSAELQKMMVDKYGSLNMPMLLDQNKVGNGAGGTEGDSLFDTNIRTYLRVGSWKCLPLNGQKLKNLKLKYTRTRYAAGTDDAAFTQVFMGKVLKAISFDKEGKAVTQFL